MTSVFISYARADGFEIAEELTVRLRENNRYQVFRDVESIRGGEKWKQILEQAIKACDIFVIIVTDASNASENVYWELEQARRFKKYIFPIQVDNTAIPRDLAAINAKPIAFYGKLDAVLREVDLAKEKIEREKLGRLYTTFGIVSVMLIALLFVVNIFGVKIFDACALTNSCDVVASVPTLTPSLTLSSTDSVTRTPRPTNTARPTNTPSSTPTPTTTPTAIPASAILYAEDFEDGRSQNSTTEGNWTIINADDGNYLRALTFDNWEYFRFGDTDWRNYAIQLDFRRYEQQTTNHIHFGFRTNSNGQYIYAFQTDSQGLKVSTRAINWGWQELTPVRMFETDLLSWNRVFIQVFEDNITVSVNGIQVTDATDETISRGNFEIGLAPNSTGDFDNILVWSLDN